MRGRPLGRRALAHAFRRLAPGPVVTGPPLTVSERFYLKVAEMAADMAQAAIAAYDRSHVCRHAPPITPSPVVRVAVPRPRPKPRARVGLGVRWAYDCGTCGVQARGLVAPEKYCRGCVAPVGSVLVDELAEMAGGR